MHLRHRLTKLAFRPHLPRRTVRLRLTLLYGGLFSASGAGLLAITYFLVRRATGDAFTFRLKNGATINISAGGGGGVSGPGAASSHGPVGSSVQILNGSAPGPSSAPTFCANASSRTGAALSKNPGCSMSHHEPSDTRRPDIPPLTVPG